MSGRDWRTLRVDVPEGDCGAMRVRKFQVKDSRDVATGSMVCSYQEILRGRGVADGTYTRLLEAKDVKDPEGLRTTCWMSDTPAEIDDHLEAMRAIERLGGAVLVNGLGLGLVVKAALSCPNVTRVDVVERDARVATLCGPTYAKDPRFRLHLDDAFTIRWPKGTRWSFAWHDVWPSICEDNLPGMKRLHRRYGGRVDSQGSWARGECERNSGSYLLPDFIAEALVKRRFRS